jgi:Zn-dependent protease with chaperone function
VAGLKDRDSDSSRGAFFWHSFLLDRLGAVWAWRKSSMLGNHPAWVRSWGLFLSLGAAFGLCRLGLGLCGVHDCRRRSIPVNDADLLAVVESLRDATGCRRAIEVRERSDCAAVTAAAVGWLRPLILLPSGWRDWNEADLKAVLAHEVAHIARGDYASGVVARFGLALHFYHPLVHWIVARLLLQQELGADAWGARLSGGSRTYLLALSRLALRLEERSWVSPAKMFLPARGQLIRRIQVLKRKMKAIATYDTDRAAESAARALKDLLAEAGPALEELQKSVAGANRKHYQELYRIARGVLDACAVHQDGRLVEVHGQKALTPEDLATLGMELLFF